MPILGLENEYEWTLQGWFEMHGLTRDDLEPVYEQVLSTEERRQVELAAVLPDPFSRLELEEDAILEAVEWRMMGDSQRSEKLLSELTRQDLRCIDAHAHLGNLFMEGYWGFPDEAHAQRHYRVGVEIAERTLDPGDVTPKGLLTGRICGRSTAWGSRHGPSGIWRRPSGCSYDSCGAIRPTVRVRGSWCRPFGTGWSTDLWTYRMLPCSGL